MLESRTVDLYKVTVETNNRQLCTQTAYWYLPIGRQRQCKLVLKSRRNYSRNVVSGRKNLVFPPATHTKSESG